MSKKTITLEKEALAMYHKGEITKEELVTTLPWKDSYEGDGVKSNEVYTVDIFADMFKKEYGDSNE